MNRAYPDAYERSTATGNNSAANRRQFGNVSATRDTPRDGWAFVVDLFDGLLEAAGDLDWDGDRGGGE